MNIVMRVKVLDHDILCRIGHLTKVTGINSTLRSGGHILQWEFDNLSEETVRAALLETQSIWELPTIYLVQASTPKSWHAYCLLQVGWQDAMRMVIDTPHIDLDWFKMCVQRGHFTLRLTDKGNGAPKLFDVLPSFIPETARISDLTTGVKYEAWQRTPTHIESTRWG